MPEFRASNGTRDIVPPDRAPRTASVWRNGRRRSWASSAGTGSPSMTAWDCHAGSRNGVAAARCSAIRVPWPLGGLVAAVMAWAMRTATSTGFARQWELISRNRAASSGTAQSAMRTVRSAPLRISHWASSSSDAGEWNTESDGPSAGWASGSTVVDGRGVRCF